MMSEESSRRKQQQLPPLPHIQPWAHGQVWVIVGIVATWMAAPISPIPDSPTPAASPCPEVVFDFSELDNGNWLHDQFWDSKCVKVTAFANTVGGKRRGFSHL
jgi:hypothetical protein